MSTLWVVAEQDGDGDVVDGLFATEDQALARAAQGDADDSLGVAEVDFDRPEFDAIARLWRDHAAGLDGSTGGDAIRACAGAVAGVRYAVEAAVFGGHWWNVTDTWTGWGDAFRHGRTADDDRARADEHCRARNLDAVTSAMAELDRAVAA